MLDHQLHLSVTGQRHRGACVSFTCGRYVPDAFASVVADGRRDLAIFAACRPSEKGETSFSDHLLQRHAELLRSRTVHPYQRVLGIVYHYYIIDLVEYYIQDSFRITVAARIVQNATVYGIAQRTYNYDCPRSYRPSFISIRNTLYRFDFRSLLLAFAEKPQSA